MSLEAAEQLAVQLRTIRDEAGPDFPAGSPAGRERSSYQRPESISTLNGQAIVLAEAAADNLEALITLVRLGKLAVAPWVTARATLEATSQAIWLLDPAISIEERVGRSLGLRYRSLRAQETLFREKAMAESLEAVHRRMEDVERVAMTLGFSKQRTKADKLSGIGLPRPDLTSLVASLLGSTDLYRILSGVAHGDVGVLNQLCSKVIRDEGAEGVILVRSPASGLLMMLVSKVTQVYARTEWLMILRFGGDTDKAKAILEEKFNELKFRDTEDVRFWRSAIARPSS